MLLDDGGLLVTRWVEDDVDREALVRIHAVCYPKEAWTLEDFRRFADRPGQIVRAIVKDDGEVIGSLLYRMSRDEVRIARVAVLPGYRRRGVGSFAVNTLTAPNSPNRKSSYTARVREYDVVAQQFLRKLGFKCVDKEDGFFKQEEVPICDGHGVVFDTLLTDQDGLVFRCDKEKQARRRRAVTVHKLS